MNPHKLLGAAALLALAACGKPADNAKSAAVAANTSNSVVAEAKPESLKFKNQYLDWSLEYPAKVAAIPALAAAIRDPAMAEKDKMLAQAKAEWADRAKMGAPLVAYEDYLTAHVAADTPQLMSLSLEWNNFTGGAHPNHGTRAMLWDKSGAKVTDFAGLFDQGLTSLPDDFRSTYCAALDAERSSRRDESGGNSGSADDPFNKCPDWSEVALIPSAKDGGSPATFILVHADPYVAGPYAEGDYDIEVPVAEDLIEAMKSAYQPSFAPAE